MDVKRREEVSRLWRMVRGRWTQRRQYGWTVKIVVASCIVLFLFSPAFSRKLPSESKTYLERSAMAHKIAVSREVRGRGLGQVPEVEVEIDGQSEGADVTSDYTIPTHNHSPVDESPNPPGSTTSRRFRQGRPSQQFSRYTASFGHRHLRGV